MQTLLEALKAADQSRTAIGHFNVSESVALQAVASAARDTGLPVIVGLSEGERKFFGISSFATATAIMAKHIVHPCSIVASGHWRDSWQSPSPTVSAVLGEPDTSVLATRHSGVIGLGAHDRGYADRA